MKNILVYNNSTEIVNILNPLFVGEGYSILVVTDVNEMKTTLTNCQVHLLFIDVDLSGNEGADDVKLISDARQLSNVPIIIVSEDESEMSKILALNAGADDYVTITCNPLEILARVKSQLRRYTQLINSSTNIERIYKAGNLEINDVQRKVMVDGREVRLTPIEYKILRLLVSERGKVLSIDEIYELIWQMRPIGADNTIPVHIRHIREKIEQNPKEPHYLKVVWGTGYKVV